MVASNFERALKLLLKSEGGNDDDPADHGGRTSRGVTQREYDKWRTAKGLDTKDVWDAGNDEIATIYHDEYWQPFCDQMAAGLDYLYFDMAVNAGPRRAAVLLQRALGVADDGKIGPKTLAALASADQKRLVTVYTEKKRDFYQSLNQPRFIKGWLNRCDQVQDAAIQMLGA